VQASASRWLTALAITYKMEEVLKPRTLYEQEDRDAVEIKNKNDKIKLIK
jgi:hypothetical protein